MENSPLRIGNIVLANGVLATVQTIDHNGIQYDSLDGEECAEFCEWDKVDNARLSEEWLLKFKGVEQLSPIKFRYKDRLFFLREGVICDYGTGTRLEFVHEFQNFIHAIMKEELELKPITK